MQIDDTGDNRAVSRIATWKGRPIDSLTREELVDALNAVVTQFDRERAERQQERDMWADLSRRTAQNWNGVRALREKLRDMGIRS